MENKKLPYDRFVEIYEKQLSDERYYCLICEHDGIVVGALNLRFEEQLHHTAKIAEILEFVVAADYRNFSIGKKMFAEGCEIARKKGCIQIEVACNQLRKDTHRFYRREGMHNFHFKFSKILNGEDTDTNVLGK
ncbi:GNAT family N-acetyltransferase [Pectinatus frisingensis]|uniref:GNAT family N-acetyltransferase n=1 Tax=Pectinatus frisingensis TaxID=865 RepID=UPI003D803898